MVYSSIPNNSKQLCGFHENFSFPFDNHAEPSISIGTKDPQVLIPTGEQVWFVDNSQYPIETPLYIENDLGLANTHNQSNESSSYFCNNMSPVLLPSHGNLSNANQNQDTGTIEVIRPMTSLKEATEKVKDFLRQGLITEAQDYFNDKRFDKYDYIDLRKLYDMVIFEKRKKEIGKDKITYNQRQKARSKICYPKSINSGDKLRFNMRAEDRDLLEKTFPKDDILYKVLSKKDIDFLVSNTELKPKRSKSLKSFQNCNLINLIFL